MLLDNLKWRYAVKKFDASKKISNSDWGLLEEALVLTPSSFGLQPWKFLVINDKETRKKLREVSWNQSQVEEASHLVVFCAKTDMSPDYISEFINSVSKERNIDISYLDGYKNMMLQFSQNMSEEQIKNWNSDQTYIALGNILTSAAMMKIDTCPMEGIDRSKYNEILGLNNSGYTALFACAFGYRDVLDETANAKKVRFSKDKIIKYV